MKKLAPIFFFGLLFLQTQAQVSTAYKTQVESIFQVNRSYVNTGLLQDYGFFYTNVEKFNGVRSDTSYLEFSEWQEVYNSLYTYRFNTNATIPLASTTFDQINTVAVQNAGNIVFAGLHYRYERFKSNAVSSNLVYISNNKIYDTPGRPTTPYEIKEAFAMVPKYSVLTGATHSFLFKPELFYSNTGKTISTLKVDFNDGAGYRTLTANVPISITYSTEGEKKLIFKITYTDASSVESHTKVDVREIPTQQAQARYSGLITDTFIFPKAGYTTKPYLGVVGGALVTVEYTNPDKIIRKPLIILSGLDGWKIRSPDDPEKNWSFEDILTKEKNGGLDVRINDTTGETLSDALESGGYDLIFVDYENGTDYIQRNAYMLESVIQWVNAVKQPYNGVPQKNVILGFSMGGLVARYALRDMEMNGLTHDTRLNVSVDSPHQGANVPVGFQAATLHFAGSGIAVGLPGITVQPSDFEFGNIVSDLGKARALQNAPASRQLLRYQVVGGGSALLIDNPQHTAFMNEYHNTLGLPTQGGIRNIAVADGSECGIKQPFSDGASFVDLNGAIKLKWWQNLLANIVSPLTVLTNYPQAAIGAGFTTRTDVKYIVKVNALTNQSASQIYRAKLSIKKKILFLINIDIVLIDFNFSSTSSLLAIDNAPGGIKDFSEEEDFPVELTISRFCHVPTFSALDIGGGTQTITAADLTKIYSAASPPAYPKNVRMDNFMTNPTIGGSSNQIHTQLTFENGNWLLSEITNTPAFFSCYNSCSSNDAISGASLLCTSETYSLDVIPSGAVVSWQATPSKLFTASSGTGGTAILSAKNSSVSGSATLNFTVDGLCGSVIVSKIIRVGGYKFEATYNNGQPVAYMPYPTPLLPIGDPEVPITFNPVCAGAETYVIIGDGNGTWEKISPSTYIDWWQIMGNSLVFTLPTAGTIARFRLTWDDGCGATRMEDFYFQSSNCSQGFMATSTESCLHYMVSPSPASSVVNIEVSDTAPSCDPVEKIADESNDVTITSASLINIADGKEQYTQKFSKKTKKAVLDVSNLRKGLYILRISDGKRIEDHRILIE